MATDVINLILCLTALTFYCLSSNAVRTFELEACNRDGDTKNSNFWPMSRYILETVQDRPIVTTERLNLTASRMFCYRIVSFPKSFQPQQSSPEQLPRKM